MLSLLYLSYFSKLSQSSSPHPPHCIQLIACLTLIENILVTNWEHCHFHSKWKIISPHANHFHFSCCGMKVPFTIKSSYLLCSGSHLLPLNLRILPDYLPFSSEFNLFSIQLFSSVYKYDLLFSTFKKTSCF